MFKLKITLIGVKDIEKSFSSFKISSYSKRKMMEGALRAFYKIEKSLFASGGGQDPWQSLSDKYKEDKKRLGYDNMPIMQMTGKLKNALTGHNQRDTYVKGTSDGFSLYLLSNYWHNHQHGSTAPMRKTVNFTEADEAAILKGMLNATLGGRLARLFT